MSAPSFAPSLAFALRPENDGQGFHMTPGDPGGATAWGITMPTLTFWRVCRQHGPAPSWHDLANIQQDEVTMIYRTLFWNVTQGDQLPPGVDLMVFDMGMNAGPVPAERILQETLGVYVDGHIGPKTLQAAGQQSAVDTIGRMAALTSRYYAALPGAVQFGPGWQRREMDRRTAAMALCTADNDNVMPDSLTA